MSAPKQQIIINNNNKPQQQSDQNNEAHLNSASSPQRVQPSSPQGSQQQQQQGGYNQNYIGKRQQYQPNQPPYQPPQHNNNSNNRGPPTNYQQYPPQNYQQYPPQTYYQAPINPQFYPQGPPPQQPNFVSQQTGPIPQQPPGFNNQSPIPQPQQPSQPQPSQPQQPLSPQTSSPSSPQHVVIQPNQPNQQQNANRKPSALKPSVQHNTIPNIPRTHSAPPSLEEQQQQQQHPNNIKGFTPEKRTPIQHPPQYVIPPQQFGKPMYPTPQQMYYQPQNPYGYFQQVPVNSMIPQTTVKKTLEIIDPATNEKVIITSPPKSSTTPSTVSPTPNTSSPTTNGNSTPSVSGSGSGSTGGYVTSFSSGNVNLRKNKQSGETTPIKDASTNTSTPATPSSKAESTTEAETTSKPSTPSTTTVDSVSSTTTPEKSNVVTTATTPEAETKIETTVTPTTEVQPEVKSIVEEPPKEEVKPTEVKPVEPTKEESIKVESTKEDSSVVKPTTTKEEPTVEEKKKEETPVTPAAEKKEEPIVKTEAPVTDSTIKTSAEKESTDSTTTAPVSTTTTATTNGKVEEELEEWEKKGEEDFTIVPSADSSSSITTTPATSLVFRNSGEKIVYSKELMMSLKPKSMEEPTGPLKDLKNQIETNTNQNQLNRSGNKIGGNQQNKNMGMGGMNMNPNYPSQMNMKYPPQMNMKYPPKNYNNQGQQQGNPNFNKYAPGYQYQQQIQQGMPPPTLQPNPYQPQQATYGITFSRDPVQPPISSQPVNEKRWVPTKINSLDESQKTLRKANFILNRITPERFDILTEELLELGIVDDEKVHKGTIDLIFDKALNESKFCTMYTNLCKKIFEFEKSKKEVAKRAVFEKIGVIETENYNKMSNKQRDEFDQEHNVKAVFRTLLLSTCQKEYEKIPFETVDKVPEDLKPEEKADFEESQFKERKRIFGLIKFIGELFKQQMLSEKIVHGIMISLIGELQRPSEIKLECFCKLLSIVGKTLSQNEQASNYLTSYFQRMQQLVDNSQTLSQRIRFLIQNVMDLKNSNWIPKVDESAKTLKEVEATQNKQEDNRKSNPTGVKNTSNVKNMFNASFNFGGPNVKPMMAPPMNYNKNAPGIKPPAQFQPKPYPYNNNYNNQQQQQQQQQQPQQQQQQHYGNNMMNNNNNNYNRGPMGNMNNVNNTNNNSSSNNSVNAEIQKKWDAVSTSITDSINEFLELKDEEEFVECVKSYVPSTDLYPHVISQLISTACAKQKDEPLIKKLIFTLVSDIKLFSTAQFKSGYELFISSLPDLFEDRPSAFKSVASVFYSFVLSQEGLVTITQFANAFTKVLDDCGSSIPKVLFEFILQFEDPKKAAQLFVDNKVGVQGFFIEKDFSKITQTAISYNKDLQPFFDIVKL
ncbi:hypothetical protein ACTFIU_008025 [Dictyostelium citrinum]